MNDTDRTYKENKLEQDITLPYLKKAVIFSITFGFFGVNMAFALQSSMMGRIFQTLGANPNNLGWFFYFATFSRNDCSTPYWILF